MIDSKRLMLVTIPRWNLGVFILLVFLAMFFYPGGTYHDGTTEGYIFSQNFLSDLGRWAVYNGQENYFSSVLFSFAFAATGLVFCFFFWTLPSLYSKERNIHLVSMIGSAGGILGGIFIMGSGLTPGDLMLDPHVFFSNWCFRFFLIAAACYTFVFFRTETMHTIYGMGYGLFAFLIAVYIGIIEFGPSIEESLSALKVQVVSQKLICLTFIFAVAFQTYGNEEALGKRGL